MHQTTWKLNRRLRWRDEEIAWDKFGKGRPVVLLHGFPGNSFAWRQIVPKLAKTHTVYVYDLAGFGESNKRPDQDISAQFQAHMLCWLLDEWRLDTPDVVAHDFGASVALCATLFRGRKWNRTILLDPAVLNPCLRENSRHGRTYHEAYSTMPAKLFKHLMKYVFPSTMYGNMDEATFDGYFRPWSDREGQMAYYRYLRQFDDAYLDELESRLSAYDSSTKIVWGEEDIWIPPEQGRRLRELIPGSRLNVVPKAGHFIMEDEPAAVSRQITQFLG